MPPDSKDGLVFQPALFLYEMKGTFSYFQLFLCKLAFRKHLVLNSGSKCFSKDAGDFVSSTEVTVLRRIDNSKAVVSILMKTLCSQFDSHPSETAEHLCESAGKINYWS